MEKLAFAAIAVLCTVQQQTRIAKLGESSVLYQYRKK